MATVKLQNYCEEKLFSKDLKNSLLSLDEDSKGCILNLLEELQPSANSFQLLFVLLNEISKRDKISIAEILNDKNVIEAKSKNGSRKDKLSSLRDSLERLRFPEKFAIATKAISLVDEIRKSYGYKINLPEDLEGDIVDIRFSIKSPEDLDKKIEKLVQLKDSNKIDQLFNLLLGRD